MRGPQYWNDCPVGYKFEAGGEGESWKDVVIYNNNYYSCVKSHAKSALNYPQSASDDTNGYWQLGDKIELVATRILLAAYALIKNLGVECIDMKDADGNVLFQAKDGEVTCKTGTFDNITVQSGNIAGFKISGLGITNESFNNDAYLVFRNDAHNIFAGIGATMFPSNSAVKAAARFENEDSSDKWGIGCNVAAFFSAKNGKRNFAYVGNGNGLLDGWISGYRFSKFTLTEANTIYDGYIKLSENNCWVIYGSVSGSGIVLPKLAEVRSALGISSGNFCVPLTIVADIGTSDFQIYGRNNNIDKNSSKPWSATELPVLTHWDGSRFDTYGVSQGDSLQMLLIYDSSKTGNLDGFSLCYTARITNLQIK